MNIKLLKLENFRNFEKVEFNFPTNFTIVIGENGRGKSSVLQGLRIAASTFFLGIDEAERYHIQKEDVRRIDLNNRFVPQKNCTVTAHGELDEKRIEWTRSLTKITGRTEYKQSAELVNIAKKLNDNVNIEFREDVDLPVINYFSTARLWGELKQTFKLKKKGSRLKDGYARCINDKSDKNSAMEWIKSAYWKKLKDKPESVLLDAVLNAINTCIPHWEPTEWDEDSDDLGGIYTDIDGNKHFMPLYFLSDGLKTMAAMVAEIAYRCATLNPHLGIDAVKKSKGIVLIDEIDMHLHPKWQQNVVNDLKTAFPNIQFIATTHSPFIVQSLKADELINLDNKTDEDPINFSIETVASHIMKVEPRSKEFQQNFNVSTDYFELLGSLNNRLSESVRKSTIDELKTIENSIEINDPALAAFLKMNRLATIGNSED